MIGSKAGALARRGTGAASRAFSAQATAAASHSTVLEPSVVTPSGRTDGGPNARAAAPKTLDLDSDYDAKLGPLLNRPRGFTFGGGPGAVRDVVKARAANEMLQGGLLELSHREEGQIQDLLRSTQDLIRTMLSVPENYDILFIQGGAHAQFSAVPLNFGDKPRSGSLITGSWSAKASAEQRKFAEVVEYAPSEFDMHDGLDFLDRFKALLSATKAEYGYLCSNETMRGIQLRVDRYFTSNDVPLVVDATSDLFSRPIDISKYGVVFASGGKNLGPAGFALVVARKDIVSRKESPMCPSFLSWKQYANSQPVQNIYQTPPMLSIGLARMVLEDLQQRGGVEWAEARTNALAQAIYGEIDDSNGFYFNPVSRHLRSNVSVVFRIRGGDDELERKFHGQAEAKGMFQLNNHPSVGGMRASLYHAVPSQAVDQLVDFMRTFRKENS